MEGDNPVKVLRKYSVAWLITLAVIGVLAKLEKQKVPEKRNGITE